MLIIALAACFMLAMGTSFAFADSYNVTADFGKRVTEQGTCEEVGAVTITPDDTSGSLFYVDQVITMELLGSLEVCSTFTAVYSWDGAGVISYVGTAFTGADDEYMVNGVDNNDYVTITLDSGFTNAGPFALTFGHDDNSQLCVDLSGTSYTASDPLYQLLQASYSSSPGIHTFSGDQYIATVKDRSVIFAVCTKNEGSGFPIYASGYSYMDYKDSIPEIELCYSTDDPGQDQEVTDCGVEYAYEEICFKVTDNAIGSFIAGEDYQFTVGKTAGAKACVGISYVEIFYGGSDVSIDSSTRYRSNGTTSPPVSDIDTSQMRVEFEGQGEGTYYVVLGMLYDTCCATPGPYVIDISGGQIPCGGSFSFLDQTVANFVDCLSSMEFSRVIPYGAETATSGWFNGIVFTNPNNYAITIDCMIYEEDGDPYTGTVVVGPMGMEVGMDTAVLSPVAAGADAVFGDESYAIYATANGVFHCFMINFDLVQAQGYLAPINIMRMGF